MALGQTATQSGLAAMAGQMPERNKLIAQQQKAARALQLQQAVAGMPAPSAAAAPTTRAQVAQMGGQMAQAAGEQQVSQAKQMMQGAEQIAKLGMGEAQLEGTKRLGVMQEAARKEELDQIQRLAQVDQKAKQDLFDAQLQFRTDAAGQKLFTERQLADYAALSANRDEAFANYKQKAVQYSERNIKMLEAMGRKMEQALKSGYLDDKTRLDQASRLEIQRLIDDNKKRIAKAEAKGAQTAQTYGAIGAIMGAAGMAMMATGVGAPVGAGLVVAGAATTEYGKAEGAKETKKELRKK